MDKALNKTLAALPDDTKVFVRTIALTRSTTLLINLAWSRVHKGQRQIRHSGHAVGTYQEA